MEKHNPDFAHACRIQGSNPMSCDSQVAFESRKRPRSDDSLHQEEIPPTEPTPDEDVEDSAIIPDTPIGLRLNWNLSQDNNTWAMLRFPPKTSMSLCVVGRAQINCIQGSVEVLGYHIDASHPPVTIESPPWTSLLVLHVSVQEIEQEAIVHLHSYRQAVSLSNEPFARQLEATFRLLDATQKSSKPIFIPSSWDKAMTSILDSLGSKIDKSNESAACHPFPSLQQNSLEEKPLPKQQGVRLALCGGKGVGKSTFLRYAANRILQAAGASPRLYILDTDLGQPEMSPPGMCTLSLIEEPILTPPYYRARPVDSTSPGIVSQTSYFFGSTTTSSSDPSRYLNIVKALVQQYTKETSTDDETVIPPLLINLDGWVTGIGFSILTTLLTETIQPTHVIQIIGDTKASQFNLEDSILPSTSLQVVYSHNNKRMEASSMLVQSSSSTALSSSLEKQQVVFNHPHQQQAFSTDVSARALRSMRLCTYFLNDVSLWDRVKFSEGGPLDFECEIGHRLASAKPYVVPFEAVEFLWEGSDHHEILASDETIMSAANASIVGLCSRQTAEQRINTTDQEHQQYDEIQQELPCVGLGLIRAVDRVRRLLYILTPVRNNILRDVNVLVGSSMDVPLEFFFRGIHSEAFPYQSLEEVSKGVVGDWIMKSRSNIGRKVATAGAATYNN